MQYVTVWFKPKEVEESYFWSYVTCREQNEHRQLIELKIFMIHAVKQSDHFLIVLAGGESERNEEKRTGKWKTKEETEQKKRLRQTREREEGTKIKRKQGWKKGSALKRRIESLLRRGQGDSEGREERNPVAEKDGSEETKEWKEK